MALKFCHNCGMPITDSTRVRCENCGENFAGASRRQSHSDEIDESEKLVDEPDRTFGKAKLEQSIVRPIGDAQNHRDEPKWWVPVLVVIRWILFVPAGIGGGILANILIALLLGAGAWMAGFPFFSPWNYLLAAACGGYATILLGAEAAPNPNKIIPAIVVGIVTFMLYGVAILRCAHEDEYLQVAQCVVAVVAAAVALYQQIEEHRPYQPK